MRSFDDRPRALASKFAIQLFLNKSFISIKIPYHDACAILSSTPTEKSSRWPERGIGLNKWNARIDTNICVQDRCN